MTKLKRVISSVPLGRRGVYVAKLAVVAGAYFATAKLGLALAFENASVTAVWPPTGIALAATLLWGYRIWPGIALGAMLAYCWTGVPPISVVGIACGNTLEALAGAYLLRRVGFRASLDRVRDVLALFVLGGVVSTTVSATIGVTSLYLGDRLPVEEIATTWRTWWLGNMGGDALIAPVLLLAAGPRRLSWSPRRVLEAAGLLAALIVTSTVVFSIDAPIKYLLFPPILWGALRFHQAGAALSSLIIVAIGVAFTAAGSGPFVQSSIDGALLLAQTFMSVASVTALLLAAVTSQQKLAQQRLRKAHDALEEKVRERTAELERSNAEQRHLAAIVESSQDAIFSKSCEGIITSWNPGATRLFGYEPQDIIGRPATALIPPDRIGEERVIMEDVFAGKGVLNYETQRQRQDRSLVDVSVTLSPINDGDGAIVGCSSITRDITERKRIQEKADRLKDELFATVSHELRTPLTSIIGYTALLLEGEGGELTDQQRRFLEVTERNAKRQLRLVGDMLFVSKAEAGEFSIELGSVDLDRLVAGCVEAAKPAAEKRAVELVYNGEPTPQCEADSDRIGQLVDNLISNAIKFTPMGGRARVGLVVDEGQVMVEVENSGSFISPSDQERLFDRFYRAASASADAIQGVGLGLTIAEAIVKAHGGTIEVASDEQTGTVFTVRLPLREPSKVVDLVERRREVAGVMPSGVVQPA